MSSWYVARLLADVTCTICMLPAELSEHVREKVRMSNTKCSSAALS